MYSDYQQNINEASKAIIDNSGSFVVTKRKDRNHIQNDTALDRFLMLDQDIHGTNINKRILEREGMFNLNTRVEAVENFKKENPNFKKTKKGITGEITGVQFEASILEQGMPMRNSTSSIRKKDKVNKDIHENNRLDVNLYDSPVENKNTNINYFDPGQINSFNYSNLDTDFEQKIVPSRKKINASDAYSNINNSFSWYIFNEFQKYLNQSKFVIAPFNILNLFAVLYLGSTGNTEKDLKTIFSFVSKETTFVGVNNITNKLSSKMIMNNTLVFSQILNQQFKNYVKKIANLERIDMQNSKKDIVRINKNIAVSTKNIFSSVISPNMINKNLSILSTNTLYFRAIWRYPFVASKTELVQFEGETKTIQLMTIENKRFNYTEDEYNQVIEIDLSNEDLIMGFILPKKNKLDYNMEQINLYIDNLKPVLLDTICIPKFKQQNKFKLDSILQQMGLENFYQKLDIQNITKAVKVHLSQIIHHVIISIDEQGIEPHRTDSNNVLHTGKNFVADHPFVYYLRYIPTNAIIFIGKFS